MTTVTCKGDAIGESDSIVLHYYCTCTCCHDSTHLVIPFSNRKFNKS